jgi:hypothetical protein
MSVSQQKLFNYEEKDMFVHKTIGLYIYKLKDEAIHSERLLSI